MSIFESKLLKGYKRLIPEQLDKSQAVISCVRGHGTDLIVMATANCSVNAYLLKSNVFELLDNIDTYKAWVQRMEISADNTFLAVLVERKVFVYNAKMRFAKVACFEPHLFTINGLAWSQLKRPAREMTLSTCSKDGTVRLWPVKKMIDRAYTLDKESEPAVVLGVFQDPGAKFIKMTIDDPSHIGSVVVVAYDNTDTRILSGGVDYRIIMWDTVNGVFVQEYEGHLGVVLGIVWTHDFKRFASVAADKKVLLWDPEQLSPIKWFDGHRDVVENCTFIENDFLVTSGRDKHFFVWNTRDIEPCTDEFATILDKKTTTYSRKISTHTRGWANSLSITENGQHVCIVTSQLINSFVILEAVKYDEDWFELEWYVKIMRFVHKLFLATKFGKTVLEFAAYKRKKVGIKRSQSANFGRQISWSWSQSRLDEVNGKIRKRYSRSFSGQLSRGLSRGFSRALSRGISEDDIFDPSSYKMGMDAIDEKAESKGGKKKYTPSKQIYGERPGASALSWLGNVMYSRDSINPEPEEPPPEKPKEDLFAAFKQDSIEEEERPVTRYRDMFM